MRIEKLSLFALLILFIGFTACNDDDVDNDPLSGTASIEITDAPIDDASVEGAFVTVSEVEVDGQRIEGFNKTTVDLMALQNGNTELLGMKELQTRSYNSVTLILDYTADENGTSPGCYILDDSGEKHMLQSTSNEIVLNSNFEVMQDQQTDLLVDFDLRKTIARGDSAEGYKLVSAAELQSGLRLVLKDSTGIIQGACDDNVSQSDKIVVYAYHKGEFNRDTELQGQGENNVRFKNAVTSALVDNSGNYQLHFLEKGEYELQFASYRDQNNDGKFELQGTLGLNVIGSINLSSVNVDATATTTVDVMVTGLLPL